MARSLYAGRLGDTVASLFSLGRRQVFTLPVDANGDPTSVMLEVWDEPDGTQLNDLLAADATTPITVVVVPPSGQIPEFYGPDGLNVAVYVKDPEGDFFRLDARGDAAAEAAVAAQVAAELARDEAEDARTAVESVVATTAGLMADVDGDAGSLFRTQQDERFKGTYVSITEAPLNARRYNAKNDGVTDDHVAYQDSFNALPGDINAGGGSVLCDGQTVWNAPVEILNKAGVKFESPGGFGAFITPGAAVAAAGVPLLRVRSATSIVRGFQMENINIDMLGVAAHAIEVQGAFDNTSLRNVWVRGVHRAYMGYRFIPASTGDGISQSITLDNVQAIRIDAATGLGAACTAPLFYLDRVHEAKFGLVKAISSGQAVGGIGFELNDCEQLTWDLPSASNLQDSFKVTSSGTSGRKSQAITVNDPYLETVQRGIVAVGSDANPVYKVRLKHPRVSSPVGSPITSVFDGTHARLSDLDIYDEPVVFGTGAYMNRVDCVIDNVTDTSASGLNQVTTHPNGTDNVYDVNNRLRVDGNGIALGVDQTGILLMFSPYGGTPEWRRLKLGAPDSGGTGFRTVVAPN